MRGNQTLVDYLRENTKLEVRFDGEGLVTILMQQKHDVLIALASIEQSGLEWSDLRTQRDSLEDIFVRLVGEPIEERAEVA